MNFDTLAATGLSMWSAARAADTSPITLCVLGPPGVGKSACGKAIADAMTESVQGRIPSAPPARFMALDLSSMLPEDLMGLPFRDNDITRYCPQSWLAPFCEEGAYGVLVLDDLPAASAQVQVACRQVSLDRRIHEMHLSPGVLIIVTGNRREDKAGATTLPSHFRNSVCILNYSPDFGGWEKWYAQTGFSSDVPAFLHFRKSYFSRVPKDADKKGSFATPRTWAMLGRVLGSIPAEQQPEFVAGLVGEGVGVEFAAFQMLRKTLVTPAKLMADPRGSLPDPRGSLDSPDKIIALATGLGEHAAATAKGRGAEKVLTQFLTALGWATVGNREYSASAISTFVAKGGKLSKLITASTKATDPAARELMAYLRKNLA